MKCRSCGKQFNPSIKKQIRGGYINQCAPCSKGDREGMYLGRLGGPNKGASIEVFRTNLPFVRQVLKVESSRGPTANLIITNPANQMVRDGIAEEKGE